MIRIVVSGFATALLCGFSLYACNSSGYITDTRSANYVVEDGEVGDGKKWQDNREFTKKVVVNFL